MPVSFDGYYSQEFLLESIQDNITANAGGGQGAAFQITTQTARVTTVATAGDSIKLPASNPGCEIVIINHGANPMQVYGSSTDTIDDIATATGVSQMANSFVIYSCTTVGKWYTEGLANGYAGGLQTISAKGAITATPSATQGQGALTAMLNVISTAASGSGVTLQPSQIGAEIVVINNGANSINVFPASGDAINALGANTAFVQNNTTAAVTIFYCAVVGQWFTK